MDITPNIVHCIDCREGMKQLNDYSINLLYTDPPYNMDSRYVIDSSTGHYRFKGKGSDFMDKWEAMDGKWWEGYFKEAFRIVKYGGFVIMHNIDRQSDMWSYYARKAGFMPMQKLYWLFISNFPKATDVALMIDKRLGVKREVVKETAEGWTPSGSGIYNFQDPKIKTERLVNMTGGAYLKQKRGIREDLIREVTKATSDIAKKYDGYKYGQAALKQILEEILVFWKNPHSAIGLGVGCGFFE